jgi:hypothetical protein
MRNVKWRLMGGIGLESALVDFQHTGMKAEGPVIGDRGGTSYALSYNLATNPEGSLISASVVVQGGKRLQLKSNGEGEWKDERGLVLEHLRGCIDIDIAATPLTNTLPIRRLALAEGSRQVIKVVYIAVPDLSVRAVDQAYMRLRARGLYRYEGLTSRFEAELAVDDDGIVLDYPGLFDCVGS